MALVLHRLYLSRVLTDLIKFFDNSPSYSFGAFKGILANAIDCCEDVNDKGIDDDPQIQGIYASVHNDVMRSEIFKVKQPMTFSRGDYSPLKQDTDYDVSSGNRNQA